MSEPGPATPGGRPTPAAPHSTPDLAAVLGAAPLPLVLTTTDARVLFANRAMQRLIGVPVADLSGRFLAEFAGPPHGRLRRLAAVAASAAHPITTEVALSLGRRRSVTVRVVVSRGTGAGGTSFLVWQVTTSPTAHALPEPPEPVEPAAGPDEPRSGEVPPDGANAREAAAPDGVVAPVAALAGGGDLDGIMTSDVHALTLEMLRTAPDRPVDEVAERVAALTAQAFSGRPVRVALDVAPVPVSAVTDPVATLAAQVEAELGGGPVTAGAQGVVVVEDLETDDRFGPAAGEVSRRLGVRSVLAVPLRRGDDVVGSLAVYDEQPTSFGDAEVRLANWVAAVGGGVLDASVRYHSAATESRQLRTAMASRAVIEQAKGILMARHRVDEDAAFGMLRVQSQTHNQRLRDVAVSVVTDASGAGVRPVPEVPAP